MEILISVLIVVIGIVILIIMNFRNRKKMDEFDDFSREMQEREKRKRKVREIEKYEAEEKASFSESDYDENRISLESVPKQNEKTANIDKFGVKIVSLDDIVTEDYGKDFIEYDKKESEEHQENIRTANIFIMSGFFGETRDRIVESLKFSQRANYELGKYYYYCEKDNQSAVNVLNLAYNSGIKEAMYYIGLIEEESGNDEIAKGWYVAGAENGEINSIIRLGKIAEEKKDYEEAESIYLKIADTKNAELIYNLVRIYFKQNKREKILEWQEKLLNEKQIMGLNSEIIKNIEFMLGNEKDRKYVELINQGNELFEKRDKGNAQKRFLEAAQYNERGYLSLAKSYYVAGNGEKAKDMYEKAYSLGVKEAAYYLGMFEEKEGNIQLALDWYNEGMKKGDINSTIRLGKIAEENKDYEKSEELYLKTIDTKDARIIYNLVNLYFKQNRKEKVVEWQKKLLNEKQIIGLTFEIIKNIEFMLGSEKDKKYVELINQGNEFLEKRDYENARKLFTEAINYNERGYLELAKSYYVEGKGEKTKEVFERAYEMGVKEVAYKLGQYMDVVEGNEKEAEKWYKIGKEIGDARAIYQLAMLYETSREFGKSEEEAYGIFEISANMKYAPAIMDMAFYSDRAENKNKVKEWTSKLLNETGLIELGKNMIGDAQNLLEEMGEKIEDKISGKDYEIEYDEDLIYFIKKFKSWN